MNKHKNYHMYGLLAIVILILVIIFAILYIGRRNSNYSPSHHSQNSVNSEQAASSVPSPGTDIIKDADNNNHQEVSAYLKEQNTIITDMIENMSVKESGSAELDFLIGMIPHHEAAIEMTKSYLKYGKENEELKKLAREIIDKHIEEAGEMRELVKEIKRLGQTDKEQERAYLDSYNKTLSSHQNISHETEAASDVESAYIEGMIIHHQMATDMAKAILEITWHDEVKDIAEDIIELQKKEISEMETIFNNI